MNPITESSTKTLINKLAVIIRNHAISPKISNEILNVLHQFHPNLPKTVTELFDQAEIELRVKLSRVNLDPINNNEHKIIEVQRSLEMKISEIHKDLSHKLEKLQKLIHQSPKKSESFENSVKCKMEKKESSLNQKLPIKSMSDLEFVEDNLYYNETASYELKNYLDTVFLKGDPHLYSIYLVKAVFSQAFLESIDDPTALIETRIMIEVIGKVQEKFKDLDESKIIAIIQNYLRTFEQTSRDTFEMDEEILLDDSEYYIEEEESYDNDTNFKQNSTPVVSLKRKHDENSSSHLLSIRKRIQLNPITELVSSKEDFDALEHQLTHDKYAANELQKYLGTMRANHNTIGRYIASLCKKVFARHFISKCRWRGQDPKQVSIKTTLIGRLFVENVLREYPSYPESKIYHSFAQFFRNYKG
uniref:CSON003508 protein n=1 Tax=Culicoides sonorensis TaxID=179676 RepID=A0A336LWM5_CULSO